MGPACARRAGILLETRLDIWLRRDQRCRLRPEDSHPVTSASIILYDVRTRGVYVRDGFIFCPTSLDRGSILTGVSGTTNRGNGHINALGLGKGKPDRSQRREQAIR